jgi:hypothetical protein
MRDKLKTYEYFQQAISSVQKRKDASCSSLEDGRAMPDRVVPVKLFIVQDYINIINMKYSAGYDVVELLADWKNCVQMMDESWINNNHKPYYKGKYLDTYYLEAFDNIISMLSIGYLMKAPEEDFSRLAEIMDRQNVKDKLLDKIVCAKLLVRRAITESSYPEEQSVYPLMRQAIRAEDKDAAQQLIKEHLEGHWYKAHKKSAWYNSHKLDALIYFGYWCFEAAAITKIMELDDSSYRENQYYPKDLADYYDTVK